MIKKISTLKMSRDDWLKARSSTIGGSDAAAICGLNSYSSPYTVYAEKLGLINPPPDNEAMRQGRELEEYVARRFCEATGKRVQRDNHIITNSDYPFAHANVDRVVVGEDAGLECKTTSSLNLSRFANGEFPDNYYVQCVHYMMVTGKSRWYLAVLIFGREFKVFTIDRDEAEIEALAELEKDFYENHILAHEPPAFTGAESENDAVNKSYPYSSSALECDLSLYGREIDEYLQIKKKISELKKLADMRMNAVKEVMKSCERGCCGDATVTWRAQTRRSLDLELLRAAHPEIDYEKYIKVTTSRPFKIKQEDKK